ncbi:MAG: hypothetical protein J0I45_17465 [Bosea sp.]|nr:hypothetical protein [Bosea sp. (in: a-proteobacteria)]
MRTMMIILALAFGASGLAACTSASNMTEAERNAAAIRAFEPVNACGPGGTQDINQCASNR